MPAHVETVVRVGDRRVHRFQVVRQRRDDGSVRDWVVVDVGEDALRLASLDFEWTTTVSVEEVRSGQIVPLEVDGVPVWGY